MNLEELQKGHYLIDDKICINMINGYSWKRYNVADCGSVSEAICRIQRLMDFCAEDTASQEAIDLATEIIADYIMMINQAIKEMGGTPFIDADVQFESIRTETLLAGEFADILNYLQLN